MEQRDTILSVAGGTAGSVLQCLQNPEWVGQIMIGAIIGSVVSFFISRILSLILKKKN